MRIACLMGLSVLLGFVAYAVAWVLIGPLGPPGSCRWYYDEDGELYTTLCGQSWHFVEGDASENGVEYCPFCGRPISDPS